jgi:hypothetical protein
VKKQDVERSYDKEHDEAGEEAEGISLTNIRSKSRTY